MTELTLQNTIEDLLTVLEREIATYTKQKRIQEAMHVRDLRNRILAQYIIL